MGNDTVGKENLKDIFLFLVLPVGVILSALLVALFLMGVKAWQNVLWCDTINTLIK